VSVVKTLFILLMAFACGNSLVQGYTLNGEIRGVDNGWLFIRHRQTGQIDSCRIEHGQFKVSGVVNQPEFCSLGLSVNGLKDYYLSMFIENGAFHVRLDKDSLNDISILYTGSVVEREFQEFQRQVSDINRQHYDAVEANKQLEQTAADFSLKHPKSYVSAFALNSYVHDVLKLAQFYALLDAKVQGSYFGVKVKERLKGQ